MVMKENDKNASFSSTHTISSPLPLGKAVDWFIILKGTSGVAPGGNIVSSGGATYLYVDSNTPLPYTSSPSAQFAYSICDDNDPSPVDGKMHPCTGIETFIYCMN